jgi:iron complex outermembrane recepter protein
MTAPGFLGIASAQQAKAPLDVVVITANQREEDLQKVAISAATVPQDELQAMFSGGEDVLALSSRVPGLYAESSNGRVAPRFYVRGLGNTDFDIAASQPVSVIMDDVVMENVVLKSTPLFDLDQVEVYRGPQGTLFGRNTTAGVVRFTSARPTDTFESKGALSVGTYNSTSAEGAISGPLGEGASARLSVLYQHRDDWIDNARNGKGDDLGAFNEFAARAQVLLNPTDRLSVLFNAHMRDLDGTAAIFRANVLTRGSNALNGNYDRDTVWYDGGGGNQQAYKGAGGSAKIEYDFDGMKLTSVTAYEATHGFSHGDIDGGACAPAGSAVPAGLTSGATDCFFPFTGANDAVTYPGFIPFASDTQDGLDRLRQTTEEIRLSSDTEGPLSWTVGGYYFDGAFTITTQGPGFPPVTTVTHKNKAWALFGQASYAVTEALSVTGGVRYTEDDKDFSVGRYDFATTPLSAYNRSVSNDHVSWDVAAKYDVTPEFGVYARIADGFRGPSIQGRDVAFGLQPSVAKSETIQSAEIGWKSQLLDNTLRLNGSVFTYQVDDMQLTVVGGAGNTVQLRNADKGKAYGFEFDAEWAPLDNLVFTGGASYTHTKIDDANLATGACAQCTVTDPVVGGFARVNGNPFPNAPQWIGDITARYSIPAGDDGEFFAFTDWSYQGKTNIFLYQSVEFQTNDQFEGGLKLGYARTDGAWELALFARNITDEDNIKGAIDFNNNTAFVNDPRIVGVSLRVKH